ncbi:MAG: D-alanyl-D-alanine carboxypeptidase [Rhodospirillaceae bacterium]|nr:D-alanyl-D-alanine carboxypeptidase [Rhodospirillaceae bacterium]
MFKLSLTLTFGLVFAGLFGSSAQAIETIAKSAIIIEVATGETLMAKDADAPMAPASMSKLMTLYMLFERLKDGSLSLDDTFRVSDNAWRKGGAKSGSSTMFLSPRKRVKVEDLIRGIIVQSGNDACIVVAEGLSGSEAGFAVEMTERAREIGLASSTFRNATGWPDPEHRMTPRDLATLGQRLIEKFPEYYRFFKETEFTYGGIRQMNRNPLLYKEMGADGLKTGHTQESGFGLTASAIRNGRRLVLVVNGLASKKARSQEPERLLEWAFRDFNNYALFKAGEKIEDAQVWLGEQPRVPMMIGKDVTLTIPRKARRKMKVSVTYKAVPAPVAKGDVIGQLKVKVPGRDDMIVPLVAGADVARLGVIGRLWAALSNILFGEAG